MFKYTETDNQSSLKKYTQACCFNTHSVMLDKFITHLTQKKSLKVFYAAIGVDNFFSWL